MENMKNWNNTIITIIGTLKTENGSISFKENKFGKFTASLKVADDSPWTVLSRKATFVFVDGLRKSDVDAFASLQEDGKINGSTRIAVTGHLVRTPGKPGMNDMLNLKTMSIRAAKKDETGLMDFDTALSKEEWTILRNEKFSGSTEASEAPTAPVAPF